MIQISGNSLILAKLKNLSKTPTKCSRLFFDINFWTKGHVHKKETIVHFKKTQKKNFVNNFCVPEI